MRFLQSKRFGRLVRNSVVGREVASPKHCRPWGFEPLESRLVLSAAKTQVFDTATDASSAGWVEVGCTRDVTNCGTDFGFSQTDNASGSSGEAGGLFSRLGESAFYIDTEIAGILDLNDPMSASGRIYAQDINLNGSVSLGWFDADANDLTSNVDMLGVVFQEGCSGSCFRTGPLVDTANGSISENGPIMAVNRSIEFTMHYDPDGGNGFGALSYTLTDPSGPTSSSHTLALTSTYRNANAHFNSFGLRIGGASSGDISVRGKFFLDDVTYTIATVDPITLGGNVFDDLDNDGVFQPTTGDSGIGSVVVTLNGTDDNGIVNRSSTTLADGTYVFDDILPGTYSITVEQPLGLLDGKESAGNLGGTVDNTQDSNTISNIVIGSDGVDATGYNFANIQPSDLQGLVWEDFNNDGEVNFGEKAIENVSLTLTGTDDRGNSVNLPTTTDADGVYMFVDLRPGDYTVTQAQPAGFDDGLDIVGTVNGSPVGDNSVNDVISGIVINTPGSIAENYNFGERPPEGGEITSGQTATIGFWQNNNGQALIESLNGGPNDTQLSAWLSSTFVNMYGDDGVRAVNVNDLSGLTNAEVADFYSDLFRRKKKEAVQLGLGGPMKMDAQVMAVALATYVTNQTLAGLAAESYGFLVTENGVGTSTFNVGDAGEAFDVADNTDVAVLDLLFATDNHSLNGVLYDEDGDGDADDNWETTLRTLANDLYSAINEAGDI